MLRNILRNPPRVIDPDQRIKYGAVQALVGMAESAFTQLVQLLEMMKDQEYDAENIDKINRALMLAWSIVDQADLLRHLIESEGGNIDIQEKKEFLVTAKDVHKIRDWMRHIPQRIGNYRSAKKSMPPVLGALSFTTVIRARVVIVPGAIIHDDDCIEYHTVVLINTAMERDAQLEGEPIPFTSFRIPVDHIVLQAFGILLPLEPIVALMGKFADALAAGVQRWLDDKMLEFAGQGVGTGELMKPSSDPGAVYRMIARRD